MKKIKNNFYFIFFLIFIIFLFFYLAEYFSYLFLKNHYQKISKDLNLINIKNFSLLSRKDIYEEDMELSAFYNFRYNKNYFVRGRNKEDLIKSQYKGLFFFPPIKDGQSPYNSKEYYDVYFFGGSTSFNEKGVPLSYYLFNELKSLQCNAYEQKKLRIIHAGQSGYATINQVNRLVTDVIILKPDLVIFFDGVNDFIHSHSVLNWDFNDTIHQESLRLLLKKNNFINFYEFANLPNRFYSLYLVGRASKKIFKKNIFPTAGEQEIYKTAKYRQEVIKNNLEKYNNDYNSLGAVNYINNHRILAALTNSFNFKSMHILQPTLAIDVKSKNYDKEILISLFPDPEGILTKNEKKFISDYWFNNKFLYYKDTQKVFTTYNDKNNYYYDYSNIFLNEKNLYNIYYDSLHYTDYGIGIIIQKISDDFKSFCYK